MPKDIFCATFWEYMKEMEISASEVRVDDLVRIMVIQMSDFLTTYDAVRKRMYEIGIIGENVRRYLKKNQEAIKKRVAIYSKDQNSRLENETMIKTIPGLRSLIEKAEETNSIDEFTLKKIKVDFAIQDIDAKDDIFEIHLGESNYGENGSIS